MNDPAPTLRVRGLKFQYPGSAAPALADVELDFPAGTLTALLGPNGSGKSTLLSLLGGLVAPAEGEVLIGEDSPTRLSRARMARLAAYLPSRPQVPEDYTAREIVLMGRHPSGRGLLLETDADIQRADAALTQVDALALADRCCLALSSGERQRVLLARILCQDVLVNLLDEPTSAQDLAHELDVFSMLAGLAKAGRTVIVATHALNAAARHADRLIVLKDGSPVAVGKPKDVLTVQLLADVFSVDAILATDDEVPYAVPRTRTQA